MLTPGPLQSLRLLNVAVPGEGVALVSLAHRSVLAQGDDLTSFDDVPDLVVTEEMEQQIKTALGLTHAGWPGWDTVLAYLDQYPAVLCGEKVQAAVAEALGHAVDADAIREAVEHLKDVPTGALLARLKNTEADFAAAGGRGVDLADDIDAMRSALSVPGIKTDDQPCPSCGGDMLPHVLGDIRTTLCEGCGWSPDQEDEP